MDEMAKYFTVSENGQVEINWTELEVLEQEHIVEIEMYLNGFYRMGHTVTFIDDGPYSIDIYLSDERYYNDSITFGTYVILSYNKFDGVCKTTHFGRSDLAVFGYVKEGK